MFIVCLDIQPLFSALLRYCYGIWWPVRLAVPYTGTQEHVVDGYNIHIDIMKDFPRLHASRTPQRLGQITHNQPAQCPLGGGPVATEWHVSVTRCRCALHGESGPLDVVKAKATE